jgi:flagellar biogenesis protein FliO
MQNGNPGLKPAARGALKFVLLLVAACLVGALVGVLTEPFDTAAEGSRGRETARPATPPATPTPPDGDPTREALAAEVAESGITSEGGQVPPATATSDTTRPASPRLELTGLEADVSGLIVAIVALAGFAFLALILARRGRFGARPNNGQVHLVDSLRLGPTRSVHLLRCDGRRYLLGDSERGIHFLATLPPTETERAIDAVVGDPESELASSLEGEPGFERLLAGSLRR